MTFTTYLVQNNIERTNCLNCLVTLVVNKPICPSVVIPSIFNCLEPNHKVYMCQASIKSICQQLPLHSRSRKKNIVPLPLRIRAKNIVRCRFAFAQKNIVLLPLRFRAKNIRWPKAFLRFRTQLGRGIIDIIDRTAYIEVLIYFYLLLLSSASSASFSNFVSNDNNKLLTFFN